MKIRKKHIVIVALSLCIGYGAGWMAFRIVTIAPLAGHFGGYGFNKKRFESISTLRQYAMQKMEQDDLEATLMTIAALDLLSEGKTDEVKKFLAGKVVEFYARFPATVNPEGQEISQHQRDFLKVIEEVSEISLALKQAVEEATAK